MDTARHLKKRQIRISNQMNTFSILQAEERTVHILQAEEHQGQILFFFLFFYSAFIYVKFSIFLHGKAFPHKQMSLITCWRSWKGI